MGIWGRAVICLPSWVEKTMYQPGTLCLSYFTALLWKLFPSFLSPSFPLAFGSLLQLGCAGCEATVRSPWWRPRCLNPLEVFRSPAVEASFLPMQIGMPNTCSAITGTWPVLNPNVQIGFLLRNTWTQRSKPKMVVWKQEKQYYNTAILGAFSSVFPTRFVCLLFSV